MSFNATSSDDDLAPLAEINVTPLVDVMLVLLIIFMVTAPMLTAGMHVELPQASTAKPVDPQNPVVLTIQSDGKISLGGDEIERHQMVAAVRALMGDSPRIVHVRGDREVAYGEVVGVLDELALNGITKLSLIANQRSAEPIETPVPEP
jgi:biopolymer transport protein ExbD